MEKSFAVEHYRDWSMEPRKQHDLEATKSNFPVRLHWLLAEAEKDGFSDIISWQIHGRSFAIHKPKQFLEKLLPLWFTQKKLESFKRQLNIYGFSRLDSGPDRGCYYHELFLRGMDFLARRIPRDSKSRKASIGTNETKARISMSLNFYQMPYLPTTTTKEAIEKLGKAKSPGQSGCLNGRVYQAQVQGGATGRAESLAAVLRRAQLVLGLEHAETSPSTLMGQGGVDHSVGMLPLVHTTSVAGALSQELLGLSANSTNSLMGLVAPQLAADGSNQPALVPRSFRHSGRYTFSFPAPSLHLTSRGFDATGRTSVGMSDAANAQLMGAWPAITRHISAPSYP